VGHGRKRIPDDVKDHYELLYGKRAEERFVSDADLKAARRAWHEWTAEIESGSPTFAQRGAARVSR